MDDVGDCVVMASSWLLPSKVAVVDPGSFVDPTTIAGSPCYASLSLSLSFSFLAAHLAPSPSLLLCLLLRIGHFALLFPLSSKPDISARCFPSLLSCPQREYFYADPSKEGRQRWKAAIVCRYSFPFPFFPFRLTIIFVE